MYKIQKNLMFIIEAKVTAYAYVRSQDLVTGILMPTIADKTLYKHYLQLCYISLHSRQSD